MTRQLAPGLPQLWDGSVAWGDYDNDGRVDFIITGTGTPPVGQPLQGGVSQLWRNTGKGFVYVPDATPGLPGVTQSSVAWADYDNDGRLDFFITGYSTYGYPIAQLWRNTGKGFAIVTGQAASGLPEAGFYQSSVAWGDFDNDGRPDLLITGQSGPHQSQLLQNTPDGFVDVTSRLIPDLHEVIFSGSVAWGDYDNDGRLDVLLTGYRYINGGNSTWISRVWRNTGSGFANVTSQVAPGLLGVYGGTVAWGDYDNDGRLDFIFTGGGSQGPVTQLWRNTSFSMANTPPTAPTGLTSQNRGNNSVTLSWKAATDAQTPSLGLTYNLVLGSSASAINLAAPLADRTTGFRRVARLGAVNANANGTMSYTFANLPPNTRYYWSVQALDTALAGGPFAAAQTFLLPAGSFSPMSTRPSDVRFEDGGPSATSLGLTAISDRVAVPDGPAFGRLAISRLAISRLAISRLEGPAARDVGRPAPESGLRLTFQGRPNETLRIEGRSDWETSSWLPIFEGTTDINGVLEFTEPNVPEWNQRFYRAVRP